MGKLVAEHRVGICSRLQVDLRSPRLCDLSLRGAHQPALLFARGEEIDANTLRAADAEPAFDLREVRDAVSREEPRIALEHVGRMDHLAAFMLDLSAKLALDRGGGRPVAER